MLQQTDPLGRDETKERRGRAWLGITGLILSIVFIVVSYIVSEPLSTNTIQYVGRIDPTLWRVIVGVAVFLIAMMVMALLFAMFVPKSREKFSDREMNKEKRAIKYEEAAKKQRQLQVRKQIAKARREGK